MRLPGQQIRYTRSVQTKRNNFQKTVVISERKKYMKIHATAHDEEDTK